MEYELIGQYYFPTFLNFRLKWNQTEVDIYLLKMAFRWDEFDLFNFSKVMIARSGFCKMDPRRGGSFVFDCPAAFGRTHVKLKNLQNLQYKGLKIQKLRYWLANLGSRQMSRRPSPKKSPIAFFVRTSMRLETM